MAELAEVQRDLQTLEAELKKLEAEYNMFFSGRLRVRRGSARRVDAIMKRWGRGHIDTAVDRFRFLTMQTRYAKFVDLWDRGQRAREEGRPRPVRAAAAESDPGETGAAREQSAQRHGLPRSDGGDGQAPLALRYVDGRAPAGRRRGRAVPPLCGARQGSGDQAEESGSPEVAFRVAVKEGKVNFTVRGLKGPRGMKEEREPAAPGPVGILAWFRHITGLRALRAINDLELDRLAFFERPEPVALDRREVDEDVAATFAFDESVTLGVVEPLDLACDTHRTFPALQWRGAEAPT